MGFVSIADAEMKAEASGRRKGIKEGMEKGVQKEQANSEKNMNLLVKRIAKKFNVSEKELLALKPLFYVKRAPMK